jgi:spore germination protein GerM
MRRRVALSLAGALLLLAVGCGAPTDDQPRALNAVPTDLLAANPVTTTVTSPPGSTSQITVYYFGAERLVQVQRQIPTPSADRLVEKVVSQLFAPPREDESRRGLRTFVNPATAVLSATVENNIATIDFSGLPAVGVGNEQVAMALAQIVYTATSVGGVVGVRFTQSGKRLSVPISGGSQTSAPVGRASYAPSYGPL